jgi:hypothetical protein
MTPARELVDAVLKILDFLIHLVDLAEDVDAPSFRPPPETSPPRT